MAEVAYDFDPGTNLKQALALRTTNVDELFYGGAAGGGKSRWGRAEVVRMALLVPGSRSAIFRRTHPQLLKDVIPKLRAEMPKGVATYNKAEHTWYFTNGSVIELGHMHDAEDYYDYQGAEYQLLVFEELTQFLEEQYRYLMSRLRASGAVEQRMAELGWKPRMIATGNPGGIGHGWVKERFIDAGIRNQIWLPQPTPEDPKPGSRCFIPALLTDNSHIDAGYPDRLDQLDPILAKALKEGDWDILKGVRFTQFRRSVHVIEPADLPISMVGYPRAVGVDWGSDAPFAAVWGALLPDNLVVVYRELYVKGLTSREQANLIASSEAEGERMPHRPIPIALDPASWMKDAEQPHESAAAGIAAKGSRAWYYQQVFGSQIKKARNARIDGWSQIDELLRVRTDENGNQLPRLLIYSTCTNLIRTLPAQMRAKTNPEDVDCFVAGTMVSTPTGPRAVELLSVGDLVNTPIGPQPVIAAGVSGIGALHTVILTNGEILKGTPDHEVVTTTGLVELQHLTTDHLLVTEEYVDQCRRSSTTASPTAGTASSATTAPTARTSKLDIRSFTSRFGSTTTVRSRTGSMFTTATTTGRTTIRRIWSRWTARSTPATTWPTETASRSTPGARPTAAEPSSGRTFRRHATLSQRLSTRAAIVESLGRIATADQRSSALVGARTGGGPSTTTSASASSVAARSDRSRSPVAPSTARLARISAAGTTDGEGRVYRLTVDGCALYYANGVLVTNTHGEDHAADALRYLVMELVKGGQDRTTPGVRGKVERPITAGVASQQF